MDVITGHYPLCQLCNKYENQKIYFCFIFCLLICFLFSFLLSSPEYVPRFSFLLATSTALNVRHKLTFTFCWFSGAWLAIWLRQTHVSYELFFLSVHFSVAYNIADVEFVQWNFIASQSWRLIHRLVSYFRSQYSTSVRAAALHALFISF